MNRSEVMQLIKTGFRWAYRVFWYTLAGTIITLAIAISLVRIFLPDIKAYRGQIEYVASSFLGQEVHIRSMDARLSGLTPTIIFRGVRLLSDNGKHEIMRFAEARLGLNLWQSLEQRKVVPESFTVYGVNLGITRRKDRTLVLRGLNLSKFEKPGSTQNIQADNESSELASWLFRRSLLSLKRSTIIWHDAKRGGKTMRFDDVNIDLRNDGDHHQFTGTLSLPRSMGNALSVAFDFHGNILNPAQWQGRFYTNGSYLQIQNWGIKPAFRNTKLDDGILNVQMWGQWQGGKVTGLTADVRANNFRLSVPGNDKPLSIKSLSVMFDWKAIDKGWRLNVNHLHYTGLGQVWPQTNIQVSYVNGQDGSRRISAYSSYLQLGDSLSFVQKLPLLDPKIKKMLGALAPAGELHNLYFNYASHKNTKPTYYLATRFAGLTVKAYRSFPGVSDLDGEIWLDQGHGEARFADTSLGLNLPRLFRKPFDITQLEGAVRWWYANDAWHVAAPQLALESKNVQTQVALNLSIPDNHASPYLDLQAHFENGDASQTSRYLPAGIMHDELVRWLDRGIIGGHIRDGDVLFHGRLANFPFRHHAGTFVVDFQAGNSQLEYRKGWPTISADSIQARFTGMGMQIQADEGKLYNTQLHNFRVNISDYRVPMLNVTGQFSGQAKDAVRFLVNSPIAPGAKSFYRQSKFSGTLHGKLSLTVPLSREAARKHPVNYHGDVQFSHAQVQAWHNRLVLKDISGRIDYSKDNVSSHDLKGKFSGNPIRFVLYTRKSKARKLIEMGMMGTLDTTALRGTLPIKGLDQYIHGRSRWQGLLRFGSEDPAHPNQVSLHIDTPLKGIGLAFPPPLHKPVNTVEDLSLDMKFGGNQGIPLNFRLGERLHAALLLKENADQALSLAKGTIAFSPHPASLPEQKRLVLRGRVDDFPLDKWLAIKKQLTSTKNMSGLRELGLPVAFDMDYLALHTQHNSPDSPVDDPRDIAPFEGDIRELVYNDIRLGHFIIKTSHEDNGLRFNDIQLDAPYLKLSGSGSWFVRQDEQHTNILLTLNSDNVGDMVSHLGYKGVIKNGKGRAVVQLNWPASPAQFSLARLNGTLGCVINDGVISDVEPGAGRLVGLLSLSELPRHLALDFSDFKKGLKFKQIQAQMDIVDGDAFTRSLHIVSPIALIDINGRTGLAKRDYDLKVSVAPSVSKTLPVISWLAWGGQVGALTFLMDQLFGKDFNQSIASTYRVTGSWEHPLVKKIPTPKPGTQKPKS